MSAVPLLEWPDRGAARTVLTIDPARRLGWCAGVPGTHPQYGSAELRGRSHTVLLADLARWIEDAIARHQPTEIVIESPLGSGERHGSATTRLAYGFAAIIALVAHQHGIQLREEPAWRTRREVIGPCNFPAGALKAEVVAWCRAQGFAPGDDNAADAIVLFKHVEKLRQQRSGP